MLWRGSGRWSRRRDRECRSKTMNQKKKSVRRRDKPNGRRPHALRACSRPHHTMPPRKRGRDDRVSGKAGGERATRSGGDTTPMPDRPTCPPSEQTPPPEPAPLPPPDLPASDLEFPSDALTALLLLRAHWAADTFGLVKRVKVAAADDEDDEATTLPPTCPILLRSQVAALVTDRDAADVELDELR